ncbi:Ig-like domain-containing protein [Seonamhaeicola marinus]|uniref:T9SS type B sorting domain-containing protein n=1 Tax=Seonamhaeicola marinus TaxID=1912246 RepID=A0A5D0J9M6_9FLAO|nr:T9SS type B sorting domain-containing protein [Seonamhaeicola marinus]TYA92211.1 T9SS type B sorting domain-containing protein [Seonamhaeicola marinus]
MNSKLKYVLITGLILLGWSVPSQTNVPPNILATGDQVYCPLSQINIVTGFSIVDPDDTEIESLSIQISTGYVQAEDRLLLLGSHPNINSLWNAQEGKLTFTGIGGLNVSYSDLINAVNNVVFESSSASVSGDKFFSFTIGDANYLPSTGHYYEYVANTGITWTQARAAAAARTYFGLQGYLATITSAEEAQLSGEQAAGAGWIGGSDAASEGVWEWVTGPEAGTVFWNGGINGTTPNYANWNSNEPNDCCSPSNGDENYAHVTSPNIGTRGSWNDLPNAGDLDPLSEYHPQGYVVEYGGMPGDPIVNIAASTRIRIPEIINTVDAEVCGSGSMILNANASEGNVIWFDALSGGNQIQTGSSFTTPNLTNTTTYYVLASVNGCLEGERTPVTANVISIPTITSVNNTSVCGSGSATLSATPSSGVVNWYNVPVGGTPLANGTTFVTPNLTNTTVYYVDATNNGCTTPTRTPVTVTVNPLPQFQADNGVVYCLDSGSVSLETYNPNDIYTYEWFNENGDVVGNLSTVNVNEDGVYTVIATSSFNCESAPVLFKVVGKPNITDEDIIVEELSINNSITIDISDINANDYEFSLNNEFGPYQDSPFFEGVFSGDHILYIRDKYNCSITQFQVFILGFPKFFTPNGDSYNATWNIKGLGNNYSQNSSVYIYDRYGKLIKQIIPGASGWDGTFNGQPLSNSDYWFVAHLIDNDGNLKIYRGHFSLIR